MSNIFFCSDHHLGHSNILTFKNYDGSMLRAGFNSVEDMNETIIYKHNMVVNPQDRVYFLGDVSMGKKPLELLDRMNGRKVLIKGNHDKESLKLYSQYFDDVRGSHQFDGMILTHIPIHPQSLGRWGINVHGHLHSNKVLVKAPPEGDEYAVRPNGPADNRYFCVCMEQMDYTPISLEQLKKAITKRNE